MIFAHTTDTIVCANQFFIWEILETVNFNNNHFFRLYNF